MEICLISGSHRENSQSEKVAGFAAERLKALSPQTKTCVISLAQAKLPLWDEEAWDPTSSKWLKAFGPISEQLDKAQGFVVVSPEWSGMAPAGLKNFFLLCTHELRHKPACLVGVSAGRGGAYPIAELRMSSYKNTHICYLPDHVIVRDAQHVLNGPDAVSEDDRFLRERLDYSLELLLSYAEALVQVRDKHGADFPKYPNGM